MLSGAIKLEDLNDFILPAQDCVVPILQGSKKDGPSKPSASATGIVETRPDLIKLRKKKRTVVNTHTGENDGSSNVPKTFFKAEDAATPTGGTAKEETKAAQVSLYDCLACSGCVTTSEAVLLQDQSIDMFLEKLKTAKLSVVSFSSQSLDFIASVYGLKPRQCFRKLCWLLKSRLNVSVVLDTSVTDALLLVETLRELKMRLSANDPSLPLPLLTSHCPGWTCFAEKTQQPEVIAHISRLKTSQQLLGHLTKTLTVECYNLREFMRAYVQQFWNCPSVFSSSTSAQRFPFEARRPFELESDNATFDNHPICPGDVFHTTVMPCYDKKLEIHRPENCLNGTDDNIREIDAVLATLEIFQLLERLDVMDLADIPEEPAHKLDDLMLGLYRCPAWRQQLPKLDPNLERFLHSISMSSLSTEQTCHHRRSADTFFVHPSDSCLCCHTLRYGRWNMSSGGFLEYCYRQIAALEDAAIPDDQELHLRSVSNKDYKGVTLVVNGEEKLRCAFAYGFRNLQNVVKQLANRKDVCDGEDRQVHSHPHMSLIEVMACPRGCLHGGGQLLPGGRESAAAAFRSSSRSDTAPLSSTSESSSTNVSKVESLDDDVILLPSQHPFLELVYRYFTKLESRLTLSASEDASLEFDIPLSLMRAHFRSIEAERRDAGTVGMNVLRW